MARDTASDPQNLWDHQDVITWLLREGRLITDPGPFVASLGRRLHAVGAPVWRLRTGLRILDPLIGAQTVSWLRDQDRVDQFVVPHGYRDTPQYEGSPAQHVIERQEVLRRRLDALDPARDHTVLFELAEDGATDYLCCPAIFSSGDVHMVAYATDKPGGYSDADLAQLTAVHHALTPILEAMTVRTTMTRLLETYLGRGTAHQVLAGAFRRGDVQHIKAAVMYADLRDFTGMTARLQADLVLDALGDFFEVLVAAVHGADGEVLKFMGDAVMALFPAPPSGSAEAACAAALDAAFMARQSLIAVNRRRRDAGGVELAFGITLDLGPVAYGNIGGPNRLDFTAIGGAVNMISRLQDVCKALGEPILMSRVFAQQSGIAVEPCGHHALRGFLEPVEVFRPAAA